MEPIYIDAAVVVLLLLSALLAYNRGFTRELLAIGMWFLAAMLAFFLTPMVKPLIEELPVVGEFLAKSCVIAVVVAFALVVAGALLVLSVFTPIFSAAIQDSMLGPLDRALGFLFGIARGIVLIAIVYLIYVNLSGEDAIPALAEAQSKIIFDEAAKLIDQYRPTEMPDWFAARVDALMAPCGGEGITEPTTPESGTGTGADTDT
ncbi:MAG: CvpA family protein [Pseudomonadota bacterium]